MVFNRKRRINTEHTAGSLIMSKYRNLVFIMAFALTGGIFLLISSSAAPIPYVNDPSHASQCVQNSPSKTIVAPGETFTAVVKLKNTGSSTFSSAYGTSLYDFNYGPEVWSASGKELSGNVGPGGTATFNLRVKAPPNPGTYKFEWGMLIVYNGFIRSACTGVNVTVARAPAITLLANSQNNNITVTRGASLSIGWSSSSSVAQSCVASGSWGGAKGASGAETRTGDTATAGTKTYSLACSNAGGASSVSRTVTVNNPPSTVPSKPGTTSKPGSTSKPSTSSPQSTAKPVVLTAPPIPDSFSATVEDEAAILLSWKQPAFDGIITGYEIERSTDQTTWAKINQDNIEGETFTDTDVKFETTYYYRIRAIGQGDLKSPYASTEVTTTQFESNTSEGETVLTSEDQRVNVYVPDDAIDEEAKCILRNDDELLAPAKDKYQPFQGPYQILCKKADGSIIGNFKTPVRITVNNEKSGFKKLAYFTYASDWQEVEGTLEDNQGSFEIIDQTSFAVLGQKSTTPLWLKIILFLIISVVVVIVTLRIIYFIKNKKAQSDFDRKNEDYYHKEHGI